MAENTPAQTPLPEMTTATFMQADPAWQAYAYWAERHVIEPIPKEHRVEARSALVLGYEAGSLNRPRMVTVEPEPAPTAAPHPVGIAQYQVIEAVRMLGLDPEDIARVEIDADARLVLVTSRGYRSAGVVASTLRTYPWLPPRVRPVTPTDASEDFDPEMAR